MSSLSKTILGKAASLNLTSSDKLSLGITSKSGWIILDGSNSKPGERSHFLISVNTSSINFSEKDKSNASLASRKFIYFGLKSISEAIFRFTGSKFFR